jgi:SAM-dependent methyltransferase
MSAAVREHGVAWRPGPCASGRRAEPPLPASQSAASALRAGVVAFFDDDGEYGWWKDVYEPSLPRGFFSHEMARRRELVLRLLRAHVALGPGTRVLECGCGPGGLLGAIAATGCRTTGVDLNPRLLGLARARVAASTWAQADVESLPFRDGAFDVVLCVGVLSYLRDDAGAIAELARVVRPGGAVVIALPNKLLLGKLFDPFYWLVWLPSRAWRGARSALAPRAAGEFHRGLIRRYARRELDGAYRRAGLAERDTASVSFGPVTAWRKELLPLGWSIAASDRLSALAARRPLAFLGHLSNHWVTLLVREPSTSGQRGAAP